MNVFEEYFSKNKNFVYENGVYCQAGFSGDEFEKEYTALRTGEGRMYSDDVVKKMPDTPRDHALHNEWKVRTHSARRFVSYLESTKCRSVVEVGCGNGWLTTYIQDQTKIATCGVDIERVELEQAARISAGKSAFVYGDILSDVFGGLQADVVVLASCIQYFQDVKELIGRLRKIGAVHIFDSPIYDNGKSIEAKGRSATYFRSMGAPGMERFYYHHEKREFEEFKPQFIYDPSELYWRVVRTFVKSSPFPWIRIE